MEEDNGQVPPTSGPGPSPTGMTHLKVIQPSAELVAEVEATHTTTTVPPAVQGPSQPSSTGDPASSQAQLTAAAPGAPAPVAAEPTQTVDLNARAAAVRSVYPDPSQTAGQNGAAVSPPSVEQPPARPLSGTVLGQVPALKMLVILATVLTSVQLYLLLIYRGGLLADLEFFSLDARGVVAQLISLLADGEQLMIIVNLLICLALTLSKSFRRINALLTLLIVFYVASAAVGLLTGGIIGVLFAIIIAWYIRGVKDAVNDVRSGQAS